MAVEFEDGPEMVFAVNGNMLADKDALEQVYSLKGASGFCPCPRCDALMVGALADPNFPSDRKSTCREITTLKKRSFKPSTNESIFLYARRCLSSTATKKKKDSQWKISS